MYLLFSCGNKKISNENYVEYANVRGHAGNVMCVNFSINYRYSALIMGMTTSPRVYIKIMKPEFAHLRARGFISSAYINDSCLQGYSWTVLQ